MTNQLQTLKRCCKCEQLKTLGAFYHRKDVKDNLSYICKECTIKGVTTYSTTHKEEKRKYSKNYHEVNRLKLCIAAKKHRLNKYKLEPWLRYYGNAIRRCRYDKSNSYYKKGIKVLLTEAEIKCLWFRDKAYSLKQPSLDRIEAKGNYTYENCRFIERRFNYQRHGMDKTKLRSVVEKHYHSGIDEITNAIYLEDIWV